MQFWNSYELPVMKNVTDEMEKSQSDQFEIFRSKVSILF